MNISDFVAGNWKKGYQYEYFLPEKINHSFSWNDESINELLEEASFNLGELNSFSRFIPNRDVFIKMHVLKEAVISSRIEGTKTNIDEALIEDGDIDPEKRDDWKEVNNYVLSMNNAIEELEYLPLSNRLIKQAHKILLSSVRGEDKSPGEFRNTQNWIGGASLKDAIFIPPIHTELPDLLSDFEKFLNNKEIKIPHLIRIGIAHYQFETIHPFLDGNGRVGRLLITLYFVSNKILGEPLLYLSEFFEKNKAVYYENLTLVREKNNIAQWIKFFLIGIIETSKKAVETLQKIMKLKDEIIREKILSMGKRTRNASKLFHGLFSKPILNIKDVQRITGLSPKASNELVQIFVEKNILKETTGNQRNRLFIFEEYLKLFR